MALKLMILCVVGLAMVAAGGARAADNPVVAIETSMGTIKVELYADKAPITVKNFLGYVDDKFYDDTIFHRVIESFMIQGGGHTKDLNKKPTKEAIKNEANNGLKNERGTIAMARNGMVDTATAQFFINVVDNVGLNHRDTSTAGFGYCVFGKVVEGMDVVDKIKAVKTTTKRSVDGPLENSPVDAVTIKSVKRVEKK